MTDNRPIPIKKACDVVFAGEVGPDAFRSWAKGALPSFQKMAEAVAKAHRIAVKAGQQYTNATPGTRTKCAKARSFNAAEDKFAKALEQFLKCAEG